MIHLSGSLVTFFLVASVALVPVLSAYAQCPSDSAVLHSVVTAVAREQGKDSALVMVNVAQQNRSRAYRALTERFVRKPAGSEGIQAFSALTGEQGLAFARTVQTIHGFVPRATPFAMFGGFGVGTSVSMSQQSTTVELGIPFLGSRSRRWLVVLHRRKSPPYGEPLAKDAFRAAMDRAVSLSLFPRRNLVFFLRSPSDRWMVIREDEKVSEATGKQVICQRQIPMIKRALLRR